MSEANVGRQLYSPADIGRHKAIVTIHRLNQFYGLDWIAHPVRYEDFETKRCSPLSADILVSCVDSRSARRTLHEAVFDGGGRYRYWLDLGNTEASAQVVLGQGPQRAAGGGIPRLPCITELFPELLDTTVADDNRPSCSVRV